MLKFTVLDNKVVPDSTTLMIQEFVDIIAYGKKKKNPELANRMLLYIFWCCDLTQSNPMHDVDFREKEKQAFARAFASFKNMEAFDPEQRELIDNGISAYNYFNETSIERAVIAYDNKIDEIRTALNEIQPQIYTIVDEDGQVEKFVSNDKIIESYAKQLKEMTNYKLAALETAKKIENTGRVRAGKSSSLMERGVFRK